MPEDGPSHGRHSRADLSGALYFLLKQRVVLCSIYLYESHLF